MTSYSTHISNTSPCASSHIHAYPIHSRIQKTWRLIKIASPLDFSGTERMKPRSFRVSVGIAHVSKLFIFHITFQTFDAPFFAGSQRESAVRMFLGQRLGLYSNIHGARIWHMGLASGGRESDGVCWLDKIRSLWLKCFLMKAFEVWCIRAEHLINPTAVEKEPCGVKDPLS